MMPVSSHDRHQHQKKRDEKNNDSNPVINARVTGRTIPPRAKKRDALLVKRFVLKSFDAASIAMSGDVVRIPNGRRKEKHELSRVKHRLFLCFV